MLSTFQVDFLRTELLKLLRCHTTRSLPLCGDQCSSQYVSVHFEVGLVQESYGISDGHSGSVEFRYRDAFGESKAS